MISKSVEITLKHQYSWVKNDFWLLLGLILSSSILCNYFSAPDWITGIILMILFIRVVMFMSENGFRSTTGSAFSWKFILGLPLSKSEVLQLNLMSGLFLTLPFFVLMFSYWWFFKKSIFDEEHSLPLTAVNFLLTFSLIYITSTLSLIQLPRKEFQKTNSTNKLILFLRNISLFLFIAFYLLVFLGYLEEEFNVDVSAAFIKIFNFVSEIIFGWWFVPLFFIFIFGVYKYTLKIWNNEKMSYQSLVWNPKREYSILASSVLLLALGIYNTDFKASTNYQGEIQKLVFKKDYKSLGKLLTPKNINAKNKHDFTPMFVAIREGDIEMVKFLQSKGATIEGMINTGKYKGFDALMLAIDSGKVAMLDYIVLMNADVKSIRTAAGFSPIHYASSYCRSEMVDHLIKAGAEINVLNDKGETPLFVASKYNCFSVAISLKEAGADFNVRNKKAQTAFDFVRKDKKYSREFQYFLEKNTRSPANSTGP